MSLFQQIGGRGVTWWFGMGSNLCEKAHKKALFFLEKVPDWDKFPRVLQGFEEILQYKTRFREVTESELNNHCIKVLPGLVKHLNKMGNLSLIDLGIDAVIDWAHFVESLHRQIPKTIISTNALLTPLKMILEGN